MSIIEKFLLQDNNENQRRNYIWNTAAGLVNAGEAVILSVVLTRIADLNDVGILMIAFAAANLFAMIGKFGIRNYQVTDMQNKFSFSVYADNRKITAFVMMFISGIYCLYGMVVKGYTVYKAGSIFCMCMIYVVEAIEDVFGGLFQQKGRIDIGSKIFIIRWSGILIIYIITMLIWKNLLLASILALLFSCYLSMRCIRVVYPYFKTKERVGSNTILLKECFPLCLVTFLSYYICNAPKYAIDRYMTDEVQACFGFAAMPVFVIGLLSSFIYQPQMVNIAIQVKEQKYKAIRKIIWNQIFKIAFLTVVCLVGTYFWGIPVLSILYNTKLDAYQWELLFMVGGGGLLAVVNYLAVILTIMRKQKKIVWIYIILTGVTLPMSLISARDYGTLGCTVFYVLDMAILVLLLSILLSGEFRQIRRTVRN